MCKSAVAMCLTIPIIAMPTAAILDFNLNGYNHNFVSKIKIPPNFHNEKSMSKYIVLKFENILSLTDILPQQLLWAFHFWDKGL